MCINTCICRRKRTTLVAMTNTEIQESAHLQWWASSAPGQLPLEHRLELQGHQYGYFFSVNTVSPLYPQVSHPGIQPMWIENSIFTLPTPDSQPRSKTVFSYSKLWFPNCRFSTTEIPLGFEGPTVESKVIQGREEGLLHWSFLWLKGSIPQSPPCSRANYIVLFLKLSYAYIGGH